MSETLKNAGGGTLPRHVAIIMDGNGRWASERGMVRSAGHRAGVERLREIIRCADDVGISALTLYAFSTENWKRPTAEKNVLFSLIQEYFLKEAEELNRKNVRISIWGEKDAFSEKVCQVLKDAEILTADNTGLKLNICLNYGGRYEILRAARIYANEALKKGFVPDEAVFKNALYSSNVPELDLLIRTGGEIRISNFLLFQAAYAELYFTETYWPDFTREMFLEALEEFGRRCRRYGGV